MNKELQKIGGINFFDDKQPAINELIRVSKPSTRIVIIDETDKWVKKVYQKMPMVSNYYKGMDDKNMKTLPQNLFLPQCKIFTLS